MFTLQSRIFAYFVQIDIALSREKSHDGALTKIRNSAMAEKPHDASPYYCKTILSIKD